MTDEADDPPNEDPAGDPTNRVDVRKIQEEFTHQREPTRATFLVLSGAQMGSAFELAKNVAVFGRLDGCDFVLTGDGVSRRHARVLRDDDGIVLEDLGSANGTLVNGALVKRVVLKDGDKITMGASTLLKFTYTDEYDQTFQERMREAALLDGLTRAYNRAHFLRALEAEMSFAQRHASELSLLMFDIDHFKRVNDTHGHVAGDAVLRHVAGIVAETVRREDVFGRYGGEEFGVLARGLSLADAVRFGGRLRKLVEESAAVHDGKRLPVTISIGVASVKGVAPGAGTAFVELADGALYAAKRAGRNRVVAAPEPG